MCRPFPWFSSWAVLAALGALLGAAPRPAVAATPTDVARAERIRQLRDRYDDLTRQIEDLDKDIRHLESRVSQAQQKLASARAATATAEADVGAARQEVEARQKALNAAAAAAADAKRALTAVADRLRQAAAQDPDLGAAQQKSDQARRAREGARAVVLRQLAAGSAEYATALRDLADTRARIDTLKTAGPGPELAEVSAELLRHDARVARLETGALASDGAYQQADGELSAAAAALQQVQARLDTQVRQSPEFVAAIKTSRDAEQQAAAARDALRDPLNRLATAQRGQAQAHSDAQQADQARRDLDGQRSRRVSRRDQLQKDRDDVARELRNLGSRP